MQNKILFIIKLLVAFIIMFIADLIAIVTFVLTFFQGRRVIREFILSPFARIVLYIFGISYTLHKGQGFSQGQKVYISNHTSTIDVFVLCALALPNTRFFMSKVTYKFLPLTIAG